MNEFQRKLEKTKARVAPYYKKTAYIITEIVLFKYEWGLSSCTWYNITPDWEWSDRFAKEEFSQFRFQCSQYNALCTPNPIFTGRNLLVSQLKSKIWQVWLRVRIPGKIKSNNSLILMFTIKLVEKELTLTVLFLEYGEASSTAYCVATSTNLLI